jgi:chloramphenicol 3-O-phosphotransferase
MAGASALQEEIHRPVKHLKQEKRPLIAVVGPCASGKSLLVNALQKRGYNVHEVAQEHSYVPTMWQHFTQPDLLVYLDVSAEVALLRRPTDAGADWWAEQARRLYHARQHADLYIDTDSMTPREVLNSVLTFVADVAGLGR